MTGRQGDTSWPGREAAGQSDGRARATQGQARRENDRQVRKAGRPPGGRQGRATAGRRSDGGGVARRGGDA